LRSSTRFAIARILATNSSVETEKIGELSDGPTVSLDHELLAAFDAIDRIGETRLHR
jgi:hypothetical protein